MEIYKLSDEIPNERKRQKKKTDISDVDDGLAEGVLRITDLRQGVKNPERVNVFVNGKYVFSLDVAQVVDLKVKKGREVSAEELVELKKASVLGKLYQRALEWVLMRPRSIRETKDYLERKLRKSSSEALLHARRYGVQSLSSLPVGRENSSEDVSEFSEIILNLLIDKGYVDDVKFAEFYVENRFVKKGVSQKRLKMELMKKGVAREVIDEVLDRRDDEEELRKMIARKRSKYDDEKLVAYLVRQGFTYDLVKRMIFEESD